MHPSATTTTVLIACLTAATAAQTSQETTPSISGKTVHLESLRVDVGPTRVIAREARSAQVTSFANGTLVLTCGNPVVATNIRSSDWGQWWEPQSLYMGFLNTEELSNGNLLVIDYNLVPLSNPRGRYTVTRYTSSNQARSLQGPFRNGLLSLPTALFKWSQANWFNDILEMPNGDILGAVQGSTVAGTWMTALVESTDGGVNWTYKSLVASAETISDPTGQLTKNGWPLYYATEPALLHTGGDNLICVMRATNDERNSMPLTQVGPANSKYHDLAQTVPGNGIFPGLMSLPSNRYYKPGPRNAPLIISHSADRGATWTRATPMAPQRGVFPRLASDGAGLIALTYGGLSGVPRWGNAISFSINGGQSWSGEVNFGPFLTTGYTWVVARAPGRFVCFFDCTPPQPWTNYQRWWVGAVDIVVTRLGR